MGESSSRYYDEFSRGKDTEQNGDLGPLGVKQEYEKETAVTVRVVCSERLPVV